MPFANVGGLAEQEYFADGMVDELITALSRFKTFAVVSRTSSFVFKGKAVDIREAARELGVRYLLEGGVRRSGERLRVTAQLVDAETGAHLWAEKFEGATEDIFAFQDAITEGVVGLVEPTIRKAEIDRARRKRPESLEAYDSVPPCAAAGLWDRGRAISRGAGAAGTRHRARPELRDRHRLCSLVGRKASWVRLLRRRDGTPRGASAWRAWRSTAAGTTRWCR